MKHISRILVAILIIAMMLPTFAACKKNKGEGDTTAAQSAQGEVTTVEEEVPEDDAPEEEEERVSPRLRKHARKRER